MMQFKELLSLTGMSQKELAEYFNIPYRTMQNWSLNTRKCPDYLLDLMLYKLKNESIIK